MRFVGYTAVMIMRCSLELAADFIVIRHMCAEYSVEVPMTAADLFKLEVHGLNTLGEKWELLNDVYRLQSTLRTFAALQQSL